MARSLPLFARWLLYLAAPAGDRASLLADLEEEAAARAERHGRVAAHRWSLRQVFASLLPLLAQRLEQALITFWRTHMTVWRGLRSDLVLALRRLRQAPGFAFVCIITLALGIGGNTAVFTLIDRVVLKPLPVPRASELYRLGDTDACCVNSGLQGSFALFSYDLYTHLRDSTPQFTNLAAFQANVRAITIGRSEADAPGETLNGAFVSGNYFQTFELTPAAGRLAQPSDDRPGAPPVAVISHRAWIDRFQGRADVIGRILTLNGVPATLVGVTPAGFYGETLRPGTPDIWVPLSNEPLLQPAARLIEAKPSHWLYIIGRLPPGTPTAPIAAQVSATLQQWATATLELTAEDRQQIPQQHINVISAAGGVNNLREEVSPSLALLQVVAAAVLIIACANLANLLLARGMARRTETAVRVALGAPRARLIAQMLVESLVLAVAGGIAGIGVAFAGARAIIDIAFRGASLPVDPAPSPLVLGFAFLVALATGVGFGIAPAIFGSRSDPIEAMRGAGRTTGERGSRVRRSLVALQVALSLVLITCAGLLGRTLSNLQSQDFGFRPEGRFVVSLAPSLASVAPEQLPTVYAAIRDHVRGIPGVANAAFSLYSPMSGDNWSSGISVEGHGTSERINASWNRVSPGYFDTIGTPLIRGRAFDERDRRGSRPVAVVSQAFVDTFLPTVDPIGRHVGFTRRGDVGQPDMEIIGVVGNAKYQDGRRPPFPMFFMPFLQESTAAGLQAATSKADRSQYPQALEVQTTAAAPTLAEDLRRGLADVDRRIIVRSVKAMEDQIAESFNLERLIARLTVAFGSVALLLACLGLYGVTAYSVTRRTREIGIRVAVGASRPQVLATVLRGALAQLAAGAAIGLPAAFGAGRLLQANLFGVSGHDPAVLAFGVVLLTVAATAAALIPARRAAMMDPMRALRIE